MDTDIRVFVREAAFDISFRARYSIFNFKQSQEAQIRRLESMAADLLADEVGVRMVAEAMDKLGDYSGPGVAIEYEIARLAEIELAYEAKALRQQYESMHGAINDSQLQDDRGHAPSHQGYSGRS